MTAFIGPSGCGKSTLLHYDQRMYDLYPNQRAEGEILLNSQNLRMQGGCHRTPAARVGMVFKPTPFPMSIFDNIAAGVSLPREWAGRGWRSRWSGPLVRAPVGRGEDKLSRARMSLSGGQQRVTVHRPRHRW